VEKCAGVEIGEIPNKITTQLSRFAVSIYCSQLCPSCDGPKPIELNSDTRICSLDIENMYTNIPRKEVINITNNVLESNVEIEINSIYYGNNNETKLLPV
jgi:hypothetical protein